MVPQKCDYLESPNYIITWVGDVSPSTDFDWGSGGHPGLSEGLSWRKGNWDNIVVEGEGSFESEDRNIVEDEKWTVVGVFQKFGQLDFLLRSLGFFDVVGTSDSFDLVLKNTLNSGVIFKDNI